MPPRWKTAVVVWLAIYPCTTFVLWLVGPKIQVAYTGRTRKPPLAGAFLWLRGKDSNLDYLIQSYLPVMTVSVNGRAKCGICRESRLPPTTLVTSRRRSFSAVRLQIVCTQAAG
jgi:hypothetical protein